MKLKLVLLFVLCATIALTQVVKRYTGDVDDIPVKISSSGLGDVVGPASSTNNNCAKFGDTSGKLIADAGGPCSVAVGFFGASTAVTSSFSATPTFSLADVSAKSPTRFEPGAMTANVSSVTFSNKTAGAKFSIAWLQDGTGSRTVTYGASASGICAVTPTVNKTTTQFFEVKADGTTVVGTGCSTDEAGVEGGPEAAAPGTPATGTWVCWTDSTNHVRSCKQNNSSIVSNMVVPDTGASNNFLTGITAAGAITKAQPTEANLSTSDITTNNCSTSKHGLAPKGSGVSGEFLKSDCTWATPAGGSGAYAANLGPTGNITMTGSDVTIFSVASVPALAAGGCYWMRVLVDGTTAFAGAVLYVDSTSVFTFGSLGGTNAILQLDFSYCNNAGVQNAQSLYIARRAYAVDSGSTTWTDESGGQAVKQTPTAIDWSSSHTVAIKGNWTNTTIMIGQSFRIGQ